MSFAMLRRQHPPSTKGWAGRVTENLPWARAPENQRIVHVLNAKDINCKWNATEWQLQESENTSTECKSPNWHPRNFNNAAMQSTPGNSRSQCRNNIRTSQVETKVETEKQEIARKTGHQARTLQGKPPTHPTSTQKRIVTRAGPKLPTLYWVLEGYAWEWRRGRQKAIDPKFQNFQSDIKIK